MQNSYSRSISRAVQITELLFRQGSRNNLIRAVFLLLILSFLFVATAGTAAFDLAPYQIPASDSAAIPEEILYPEYFRQIDQITLRNIVDEFRSRFEFFSGLRSDPHYRICFKMQRRINKALDRMIASAEQLPFNFIDDRLIYSEDSPLFAFLRPMPLKISDYCSFKSFGDLRTGGTIYCSYHGPDIEGSFFKDHAREFTEARPAFTAFDLVELLIFFPALIVIPVTWLILKKALEKKPQSEGNSQG